MNIRIATLTDAEEIIAFDHIATTDAARRNFILEQIEMSACYIASIDARTVAYGVLNYKFFDNGWIEMLYVHPDFRRRGIGSALIRYMINECRTLKLFTSTNQSNLQMQELLSTLEFKRSGYIENLDEGDPELVYIKRLA